MKAYHKAIGWGKTRETPPSMAHWTSEISRRSDIRPAITSEPVMAHGTSEIFRQAYIRPAITPNPIMAHLKSEISRQTDIRPEITSNPIVAHLKSEIARQADIKPEITSNPIVANWKSEIARQAGIKPEITSNPIVANWKSEIARQAGIKMSIASEPAVADQESEIFRQANIKQTIAGDNTNHIWQNPRVAKLISGLLSGKITRIDPEINLGLKDGFLYREADDILGTSGKETSLILESITKEGLLLKRDSQKMLVTPAGSVQLMPVERCPYCGSEQVNRGQLIEHFNCGYIGLEEEFTSKHKQSCPKCHRELKLIGTDYRKPGARYVCNSCREIFASPAIKCRCLKTGDIYPLEELLYIFLYSYCLNEAHRKRLEFEFEPKKQLIDYLQRLGYNVKESVKVRGRSGASHTIDLLASVDDPITGHNVAIGILAASSDETEVNIDALFSFDSKIYDTGIDSKMVIAVPQLTSEAAKFAERQSIRVYSLDKLRHLSSRQIGLAGVNDDRMTPVMEFEIESYLAELGPKGWLRWLLEKKGYRVEEKYMLKGRSGAEHILDFYAQKDDGIMNHSIAVCVIAHGDNQENDADAVISFDSATYDVGIRDKVIISVPELSKEARQFADYQRIKILEAKDLTDFSRQYLRNATRANMTR